MVSESIVKSTFLVVAGVLLTVQLALIKQRRKNNLKTVFTKSSETYEIVLQDDEIIPPTVEELMGSSWKGVVGAVATFAGVTRDNFEGKTVTSLEYEAYGPMAVKVLEDIIKEAFDRNKDLLRIFIIHKLGSCPVGKTSVFIATLSSHRGPALSAVPFLIDELKSKVPIWKLEQYAGDNEAAWKENKEWFASSKTKEK